MLPPFYRTFTQNEDVITSNKCLKYNYPTKTQKAYTYGWFDLKCFLGRLRQARLTGYTDIKMLIAKDLLLKKKHPETNV